MNNENQELDENREIYRMVRFLRKTWDEIDNQFPEFERDEKIQILISILGAIMAFGKPEGILIPFEEIEKTEKEIKKKKAK
jgi:hypothetical protein